MQSPALAALLAPYTRAVEGDEIDKQDPLYSLLFQAPTVRAKAGQNGTPGVNDPSDVVALGKQLAAKFGWKGNEWKALYELWQRESGWNPQADNPTSSAFGIPQALTGTHDVSKAYMKGDPRAQIMWGLRYILDRYSNPTKALNFWDEQGWY